MTLLDALRDHPLPTDMKGNTYHYKGLGRLVFEGTKSPTDKTRVVKVEQDRMEDGTAPGNPVRLTASQRGRPTRLPVAARSEISG